MSKPNDAPRERLDSLRKQLGSQAPKYMAESSPSERAQLRAKARDLDQSATDLRAQFDALHAKAAASEKSDRFLSSNRKYFWRVPWWLWVPAVVVLFSLLIAAFFR